MPDGLDWMMRPVLRRMIRLHELYDGTYDLEHIALLNDALDVFDENSARAQEAAARR